MSDFEFRESPRCPHCLEPMDPDRMQCRICGKFRDRKSKRQQDDETTTYLIGRIPATRLSIIAISLLSISTLAGSGVTIHRFFTLGADHSDTNIFGALVYAAGASAVLTLSITRYVQMRRKESRKERGEYIGQRKGFSVVEPTPSTPVKKDDTGETPVPP